MGNKKLSKLKSILRRLHSFTARLPTSPSNDSPSIETGTCQSPTGVHQVLVGKSRRRYLVASELAAHPIFQVLLHRFGVGGADVDGGAVDVVECEVVLFEHLLWMLENGDHQNESVDELVEFYAC